MTSNLLCKHCSFRFIAKYNSVSLYQCSKCGLVFSEKQNKTFNPKKVYTNYYKNELKGRFRFGIENIIKIFRFFRAYKITRISPKARTILDIGCGRGYVLYFLKKYFHYIRVEGTQIEPWALKFAREKLGLVIYDKELTKLKINKTHYDIITLWHVLEHLHNPEKYIQIISKLLKKGGKLIIEVPNYGSWSKGIAGKYWLGYDLKYHLSFFTYDTLVDLLERNLYKVKYAHTFSLEYSTFISVQSIVSFLTQTDHDFFSWLETGRFEPKILLSIILFVIFWFPCLIVNLFFYYSRKGEILLVIAEK